MTGTYPRAYWHVHIGNDNIHISWGPVCPGDGCDGLVALADEALKRAFIQLLRSDE